MKISKSSVTTHVLDTSRGKPAAGITVIIETCETCETCDTCIRDTTWKVLATEKTDLDGRVQNFSGFTAAFPAGLYRLTFEIEPYFKAFHLETFYPNITVAFRIKNVDEHHHVPLLVNPFGYSTYRGS
jgi:5-hydroxyisourate hydrolase